VQPSILKVLGNVSQKLGSLDQRLERLEKK
jgi:hypothetical protein